MTADPFRRPRANAAVPEVPPAGSVKAVLSWVGRSPDRARTAMLAEKVRASGPRATLVARLQAVARG